MSDTELQPGAPPLVRTPASWLREFLRLESAGGLTLGATALFAMLVANSPLSPAYSWLLDVTLEIRLGGFGIEKPFLLWVNDGLMAVFFLLVGLELKREVLEGHLSSVRNVSLPGLAAVGGMLVPAGVYTFFNSRDAVAMKGWAIPSATDIAFALGILSLLGNRVPSALKAFILSIAIFDDLGAIVIIALFYTADFSGLALGFAGSALIALFVLNRAGVTRLPPYCLIGLVLWVAVLKSGVHATLAGVALALFIPLRPTASGREASPLDYLEHALHPWVAFGILPAFAFVNAGVPVLDVSVADLLQPVPLGIMLGLVVGKLIGITAMSLLGVVSGVAALPEGVRWADVVGVSLLCGVGFTMSLFIASLAFEQGGAAYSGVERLGILGGSTLAGAGGYLVLRMSLGSSRAAVDA